jgi:hypothetical protein
MAPPRYIAYFDESGDHGMAKIDPTFPVFVLCGCVFRVDAYLGHDLPAFSSIKFKYFGHDAVIFHSREIRKQLGYFQILQDVQLRQTFMADVATHYQKSSATLIAAAINKSKHKYQYAQPVDPYSISLLFCLERLFGHLKDCGATEENTVCVFEQRGKAEDESLAAHFAKICGGANQWGPLPFRIVFASKMTNMPGLQIADLAAYPIARHVMDPKAANPAFNAIYPRFRRSPSGQVPGWGLKIFP